MLLLGIDIGGSSVKVAVRLQDGDWRTARSDRYESPDGAQLTGSIREAVGRLGEPLKQPCMVGACLPGLFDAERRVVVRSVNVSCLEGVPVDRLLSDALTDRGSTLLSSGALVATDAYAALHDWTSVHRVRDRVLGLSLGTGVGACVLDMGVPLRVSGASPGHFGQLDVSVEADPADRPIGPDGGRGGLEGYLGARAMVARLGDRPEEWPQRLESDQTPLMALARAIRIAHAIYRPNTIVLLGGVGMAIRPCAGRLESLVRDRLTSLAQSDWSLAFGDDDFHAARGAARLAAGQS